MKSHASISLCCWEFQWRPLGGAAGEWPGSVTTQALRSASWHGHVERGLQLLMQLIDMSSSLPPLEERAAVHLCLA